MSTRNKIVLANGVFDLLHVGHIWHLEAAARLGSLLVVSVTDDSHVNKGPSRPVYAEEHRAELLMALKCVDDVVIVSNLIEALEIVKPDILVKGIDYKGGLDDRHTRYCKKHGIEICFTETPKMSASKLLNESRAR